jgi:hypothetical protein
MKAAGVFKSFHLLPVHRSPIKAAWKSFDNLMGICFFMRGPDPNRRPETLAQEKSP